MKMYLAGEWVDRDQKINVVNPFNGQVFDTVPRGGIEDVEAAIASAERGAKVMAGMSGHQRYEILMRAVGLMKERVEDLGRTITMEEGKIISEGIGEAERAIQTMTASAEEAKRLFRRGSAAGRRAHVDRSAWLHAAGALRGGRGDQPVQLPTEPGCPQGGACACRWERGNHQARVRHAAVGVEAD